MIYRYCGKSIEVSEKEAFFLLDHEYHEPGACTFDNVSVETYPNGLRSICTINRGIYGSGSVVEALNDIQHTIGQHTLTLGFGNGDWLEEIPMTRSTLYSLLDEFGLKLN